MRLSVAAGSATHAEWPVANPNANDNIAATQIQGHSSMIMECDACHTESLGTLAGPHGLHPVGSTGGGSGYSATWVNSHHDYIESNGASSCQACHGMKGEGTVLAVVATERTGLNCASGPLCSNGSITLKAGTQVACSTCHSNPYSSSR